MIKINIKTMKTQKIALAVHVNKSHYNTSVTVSKPYAWNVPSDLKVKVGDTLIVPDYYESDTNVLCVGITTHNIYAKKSINGIASSPSEKIVIRNNNSAKKYVEQLIRDLKEKESKRTRLSLRMYLDRATVEEFPAWKEHPLFKDKNAGWVMEYLTNSNPSPKNLAVLYSIEDEHIRKTILAHKNATQKLLNELPRIDYDTFDYRSIVARNPNCSESLLRILHEDSEETEIQIALSENTSTPRDILIELAEDERYGIREGLAKNSSTPSDLIVSLFEKGSHSIDCALIENEELPKTTREDLFHRYKNSDFFSPIITHFAKGDETPIDLLRELATSDSEWTIDQILEREYIQPSVIEVILSNKNINIVRKALAHTCVTPDMITKYVSERSGLYEAKWVMRNPNVPTEIIDGYLENLKHRRLGYWYGKDEIFSSPSIKGRQLRKLADECSKFIDDGYANYALEGIAKNKNAEPKTLEKAFKHSEDNNHKDRQILFNLAENPRTPNSVIMGLMGINDFNIHIRVAKREKASKYFWDKVLEHNHDTTLTEVLLYREDVPLKVLTALSTHENSYVRANVVANKKTPLPLAKKILKGLMSEDDHFPRVNIAKSPKTSKEILLLLKKDSHKVVRGRAIRRLRNFDYKK